MNKIYLCGDIHQEIDPVYDFVDRLHERNINLDKTDFIIFFQATFVLIISVMKI